MKRITFILVLFSVSAFSQITVNSWDFLGPNEIVIMSQDDAVSITHTPPGPNQIWDYGALNNSSSQPIAYGPAQWFENHQLFPNANFGSEDDGSYTFFSKTDDSFDLIGFYGFVMETGENMAITFDPFQRQLDFPMEYGQNWENVSAINITDTELEGMGDSVVVTITTHRTGNVDAWGMITTPFGTFDVLRLHTHDSIIEEVVVYALGFPVFDETETSIENNYSFLSDDVNSKYFLLEYTYDPDTELLSNVEWQMTVPLLETELNTVQVQPELFPNPSSNSFTIKHLTVGNRVSILSSNGKLVGSYTVTDKDMNFDVSEFTAGNYTVLIRGKKSVVVQKLIVN